jgi:hypothetical protein
MPPVKADELYHCVIIIVASLLIYIFITFAPKKISGTPYTTPNLLKYRLLPTEPSAAASQKGSLPSDMYFPPI